jgi:hypothetical protein
MPFTLSHPAACVPLARRGLILSALVVGSMAPDFGYYSGSSVGGRFSHSLLGAFLFCIPAGLTVLWVFHTVLKRPLVSLLPMSHQVRLIPVTGDFSFGPRRQFVRIVISLIAGTLTHIAWDSFTHRHGWAVQHLPALRWPMLQTAQGSIRLYSLLQHGSTLAGAALLCYWYARWFRRSRAQSVTQPVRLSTRGRLGIILAMGLGACALAVMWGSLRVSRILSPHALRLFMTRAALAGMLVLFVELIIFSGFWHLTKPKERAG